jgi:hypothetical protein
MEAAMFRRTVTASIVLLISSASAFSWTYEEEADSMFVFATAYEQDTTGSYRLEFSCDDLFPEDVYFTVLTPTPYGKVKSREVPLTVTIGSTATPMAAELFEIEENVAFEVWDAAIVRTLVNTIRSGSVPVTVAWDRGTITFPNRTPDALGQFLQFCSS